MNKHIRAVLYGLMAVGILIIDRITNALHLCGALIDGRLIRYFLVMWYLIEEYRGDFCIHLPPRFLLG